MKEKEAIMSAMKSLEIESDGINQLKSYLDEKPFMEAVHALAKAERIATCASGSSGFAAMKFSHSLNCIELPAKFMAPSEAVHGGLGYLKKDDVVVMVSRGGKTVELLPIIKACKEKEVILIGVTENLSSTLAQQSDIVLPLQIEKESDKFNVMATTSFIVTIALFDALLVALMEVTGYKLEQFAKIHPGGAVGDLLNK
ncbi:MAG: SIS domain-containing protein [Sphaerochaetaceae bacterium]|jgi:D-arabinose 5-phosphate isomerase GutQ